MQRAFADKDPAFDGLFIVAVRTTGIFCRPVCRARPPRPENVEFFGSPSEALAQGYRPCKLCRPTDPPGQAPAIVDRLKELAASAADSTPLRSDDLRGLGIDPTTARRQFRAHVGVTFAAYQRSLRMGTALAEIRRGATAITAQVAAGFESASGFRDAFARLFGIPPTNGSTLRPLAASRLATPIGPMIAVADDEHLLLLDFLDRRGLPGAIQRLQSRLGAILPGDSEPLRRIAAELGEYFAGRRTTFTLPLAPHGTPFERRAWDYLRSIPPGETRTYGEQAKSIGAGGGARAVGRANGMNYLSIVIPCHRVVGANGALTGYGGGLWRKRWLLDHERKIVADAAAGFRTSLTPKPQSALCTQGGA
jgi:AraC family transcriptional regulator of adaptative response/methylated-DNA-[protein]-cysteine methyltransferase